jgi:GNAT superfamily N-acetyltransferase
MSAVQIQRIDPRKARDVRLFDRVPFQLYAGSPYWVPPAPGEIRDALDVKRHPYYEHSEAAFFVAQREGKLVGRIGVCDHRPFRAGQGGDVAYFNCLETIDDEAVAAALLDTTADWARQRGLKQQVGPIDFFLGNGFGVLVEGFDKMPIPGIPYHRPHVARLLEGLGFSKEHDVLSGMITGKPNLPANAARLAEQLASEGGIRILRVRNKAEMRNWLPQVGRLFQTTDIPGQVNVPITDAEWKHLVDHFWPIIEPDLVKLAVCGDEVVGALLAYVHLGEALQKSGGRLLPLGWFHLWRALRAGRRIVINALRVAPAYHGSGVNLLLYLDMFRTLSARPNVEEIEIVQVGEKNIRSFGDMSRMGVQWTKRHRVFGQAVPAGLPTGLNQSQCALR